MANDNDDFADRPVSINEIKSDKTRDGSHWTPRDALIAMLRQIDSGKMDVDALVLCFRTTGPGAPSIGYWNASPDNHSAFGVHARAGFLLHFDASTRTD